MQNVLILHLALGTPNGGFRLHIRKIMLTIIHRFKSESRSPNSLYSRLKERRCEACNVDGGLTVWLNSGYGRD